MALLLANLTRRAEILRSLRLFFDCAGFLEVETPVKIHAPAPEEYIESVRAEADFLRTSPELAMKILLSRGARQIYQLGSCFRANESGRKHLEEFTMLEFYSVEMEYLDLARFTAGLVSELARRHGGTVLEYQGRSIDVDHVEFITVEAAFQKYAGVSCFTAHADDTFDEIMVTKIEPELGKNGLTFLTDYPLERAALSRVSGRDPRVAERWELYIAGLELANAFGELTDAAEQKRRFAAANQLRKEQKMHTYPEPAEFYASLERGLPESSGCALGFDRLMMIFCNAADIREVRITDR